jgi:DsbC/DsbD-like thiol-disulfide interchange protein
MRPAAEPRVASDAPRTVSATARLAGDGQTAVAPGGEFDAVVTVTIEPGWHLNANPAGAPELKPTTLGLDPSSKPSAELVEVKYPAGEAKALASTGPDNIPVYEGKVEINARIRLAEQARPGPLRLTLVLGYQACNDKLCLAPARLEVPLDVNVGR